MKILYLFALIVFCYKASAQTITFQDPNLKAALLGSNSEQAIAQNAQGNYFAIDANNDDEIQMSEAQNVYRLTLIYKSISNASGLELFPNLNHIEFAANQFTTFDATILPALKSLHLDNNLLTSVTVAGDSQLEVLKLNNNMLTSVDLTGLVNLKSIGIYGNPIANIDLTPYSNLEMVEGGGPGTLITTLDLSGLSELTLLYWNGPLTSLDLSGCVSMETIGVHETMLTQFDFSHFPLLRTLWLDFNQLTSIDVFENPLLEHLTLDNNNLTSLTVNSNVQNFILSCGANQITQLNVSGMFERIYANNNMLQTLDMNNVKYGKLYAENNMIETLFLKNGQNDGFANRTYIINNPLQFICADTSETAYFEGLAEASAVPFHVNPYCTFQPGGTIYSIQGTASVDLDLNGCDETDINYPNLKLLVSNGADSVQLISDASGDYSLEVNEGSFTLTPQLENPEYFSVFPTSIMANFPEDGSSLMQNLCITPNGVHKDLEITLIPTSPARPGFDSQYRIFYKNNGTVSLSGNVSLTFEDDLMDFISAIPSASVSDGMLAWTYADLQPFEMRTIEFILNINAPTDIPAVNIGEQLDFVATIDPISDDETILNNISSLKQNVVGSVDPNDKTCLEGNIVSPEMIGQYVHYLIRFENIGNYAAENIVVKDIIDTAKFDTATMIPLHASHPFETRITGNEVEFIFENIMLPFDDENNDGYIVFKIRTNSSLQTGDTFENSAKIFFDYNFPIETNIASTAIQSLNISDADFDGDFTIYPNPVGDHLNILVPGNVIPKSAEIYNMLGQLVIVSNGWNAAMDVSMLTSRTYLIKIVTDKGTSVKTFVRK